MREIFKQLGFDEKSIEPVLAKIKSRYKDNKAKLGDKDNKAKLDYTSTVKQYQKEIADLQKAVTKLNEAISALSPPVSANLCAQFPLEHCPLSHFTKGIEVMALLGDMPVTPTAGPNNPLPYPKTIVRNRFVLDVATAYRKQTGKEPTISVDVPAGNTKGGVFAAFLLACAGESGIDSKGLLRRAQALIEKGEI